MENKKESMSIWFIHLEFVILLITLIGGVYILDGKIERQNQTQCARTDKLYEMFIDLLKEVKSGK